MGFLYCHLTMLFCHLQYLSNTDDSKPNIENDSIFQGSVSRVKLRLVQGQVIINANNNMVNK